MNDSSPACRWLPDSTSTAAVTTSSMPPSQSIPPGAAASRSSGVGARLDLIMGIAAAAAIMPIGRNVTNMSRQVKNWRNAANRNIPNSVANRAPTNGMAKARPRNSSG